MHRKVIASLLIVALVLVSGFASAAVSLFMKADDIKVRVYGDTAVVTSRSTSKGKFNGQPFSELERSSDVFVKQNGQWKCVLTQLTRIVEK